MQLKNRWCARALKSGRDVACNVSTGGEPDPEDVDTDEELEAKIDMPQSNQSVKADDSAALTAQLNAQAQMLAPKVASLLAATTPAATKQQLANQLTTEILAFLQESQKLNSPPPKLAEFINKMKNLLQQIEPQVDLARFKQYYTELKTLFPN